jgi:hypothetical protein
MAELLQLYKENDMDERVVILQFQRIKLSKLLCEMEDVVEETRLNSYQDRLPISPATSHIRLPMQFRQEPHDSFVSSMYAPTSNVSPFKESTSTPHYANNNFVGNNKPEYEEMDSVATDKKKPKPLYDWEVRASPKAPPVKNISHSLPYTSPLSHIVEFELVLSPAEYAQLQEHQWNYSQNTIKAPKAPFNYLHKNTGHLAYLVKEENTQQPAYLASSTPYIDPCHHPTIRPPVNKAKWTSSQNFKHK